MEGARKAEPAAARRRIADETFHESGEAGVRGGAEGAVLVAADARGDGEPVAREGEAVLGEDGPGARRQAVELEPVGILVRHLGPLEVGPDGDPVRTGRVREDEAAARATRLRLGEGEAPRVVGVGVGRGVGRVRAGRLESRLRSENERERDGDERRVGGRRAQRRGRGAREGNAGTRRSRDGTVTPVFTSGATWTSRAAERSVPSKNSFGRSPLDRAATEAGGDADGPLAEGRVHAPLAGRGVPEAEVGLPAEAVGLRTGG